MSDILLFLLAASIILNGVVWILCCAATWEGSLRLFKPIGGHIVGVLGILLITYTNVTLAGLIADGVCDVDPGFEHCEE